jgi:hypothetical protein
MISSLMNFIRFGLRFLSLCLLAAAFIMLVIDAKRSYASAALFSTPAGEALAAFAPEQWAAAQNFVERHAQLMSAALAEFARWPAWLCLAVCGAVLAWLGKKPRPKFGFSSR